LICRRSRSLTRSSTGNEAVEPASDLADLAGEVVAVPELRFEVAAELVVDHEMRGGKRLEARDDGLREIRSLGHEIAAAFHRREEDAVPRDVAEADVRERADEHRVRLAQRVVRRGGKAP
jgi:hypothetical protein